MWSILEIEIRSRGTRQEHASTSFDPHFKIEALSWSIHIKTNQVKPHILVIEQTAPNERSHSLIGSITLHKMPRKHAKTTRDSSTMTTPISLKQGSTKKRAVEDSTFHSSPASGRSIRSVRQKVTPKKSQYFEKDGSSSSSSDDDEEQSGYEDTASVTSAMESGVEEDQNIEYDSDASELPRKKSKRSSRGKWSQSQSTKASTGNELWRQGVKTGLGPGTQVIIDKPKPRSAGKIPYKDDQIHPNSLLFLEELAQNNDREWLKLHDPDYRTSWNDFMAFLEPLQQRILEVDETIPELPLKDVLFRIYRDVRFSRDQTPYKCHFSAAFSRTGRKGPFAAYYIQIKPKGSFVGGGLWMPEADALAKLRRNIDRKPHDIRRVLLDDAIRKEFLGGAGVTEKKAMKAFAAQNAGNALKTKPKVHLNCWFCSSNVVITNVR